MSGVEAVGKTGIKIDLSKVRFRTDKEILDYLVFKFAEHEVRLNALEGKYKKK